MSWLVPSAWIVGGLAALVTVALHFISRSRPLAEPLPTARFVPQQRIQARTRSYALSDVVLLLIRLAAIASVTAAVAAPLLPSRGRVTRIVIADRSRAVANASSVRDSVRAYVRAGDQVVLIDSAATRPPLALDSIVTTNARGSLSAGIAAAVRAGVRLASSTDSLELIVVSPLVREEIDEATFKIRDSWPGRIRLVRVAAVEATPEAASLTVGAANGDDAVVAGLSLVAASSPRAQSPMIHLIRGAPSAADSSWANGDGHALLVWPANPSTVAWARRTPIDTIGGVVSASGTLIAPLERRWLLTGVAAARWVDGEPAVVEHPTGGGCIRDVAIAIDDASDITLRPAFRQFVRGLLARCGGRRDLASIDASMERRLATGASFVTLAPASALRDAASQTSPLTPWLYVLSAVFLLAALFIRRTKARPI